MIEILLKGGRVIDPTQSLDAQMDIAIQNGSIAQIAPNIRCNEIKGIIDVTGKIVVPGLIDLHCHIYEGVNQTGVNPDIAGVMSGVTTLVDAGSAGCYTFGGLKQHTIPQAKSRIICFLHISRTGLSFQPEISRREDIDLDETVRVIKHNIPLINGVKIRAVGPGVSRMGIDMVRLAKEAANEAEVKLMVHIGDRTAGTGPTLTRSLLELLDPGDIVTHTFTGNPGRILDENNLLIPEIVRAQENGVFLDTAHGTQNFSFNVAKAALDQGLRPDSISTDLTIPGRQKTVHSMTEMLSKFLALGFTIEQVIRLATANPAKAINMEDTIGSLAVGRNADVSVLEETTGRWVFHDTEDNTLKGDKALTPVLTVKDGEIFSPDWGPHPWGWLPESEDMNDQQG